MGNVETVLAGSLWIWRELVAGVADAVFAVGDGVYKIVNFFEKDWNDGMLFDTKQLICSNIPKFHYSKIPVNLKMKTFEK